MIALSQILGVPVTNASVQDGGAGGFQMFGHTITLPPIQYSDAESDTESDIFNPDQRQHSYRPLKHDEIRLLILNPGKPDDPIECYLEHYAIGSVKSYLALSYVWGSPENTRSIRLDGCTFPVTANLGAFLAQCRGAVACRVLWIDALCINQQDIPERNSQIRLMKRVYEGASQILIWLGHEVENTKAAFDFVTAKYENRPLSPVEEIHGTAGSEDGDLVAKVEELQVTSPVAEDIPFEVLEGIKDLLARPWWTRIWVYQEATAPAQNGSLVLCGPNIVGFEALLDCIWDLGRKDAAQYSTRTALIMDQYSSIRLKYYRRGTSDYLRLSDLLPTLRNFEATNPRDKLYALIPTSIDGNDLLDVDYSLPMEEVYFRSACNLLRHSKNLDFLGHCNLAEETESSLKLPSWIPDWTQRVCPYHLFKRGPVKGWNVYDACGEHEADFTINEQQKSLTSHGAIFDSIKHVSSIAGDMNNSHLLLSQWTEWLETIGFSDRVYPSSLEWDDFTIENSLLTTMVANCDRIGIDIGRSLTKLQLELEESTPGKVPERTERTRKVVRQAIANAGQRSLRGPHPAFLHRRLIVTEGGHLGLGPMSVRQGDLVVVLYGSQVPSILRKHTQVNMDSDAHDSMYILVGEAFVNGCMDGEVYDSAKEGTESYIVEEFTIV